MNRRSVTEGESHNFLTAVYRVGTNRGGKVVWAWRCVCQNLVTPDTVNVRSGKTKSCGCYFKKIMAEKRLANRSRSAEYRTWNAMKRRCEDFTVSNFSSYGGKGVKVCKRWNVFDNFLADMGARPAGKTIDRIDNSRGYSPANCRWATPAEQARNKLNNRTVQHPDGRCLCVADWARELGISQKTIRNRLSKGWPPAKVLTTPVNPKRVTRIARK